jgi:hypothetical protein
VSDDRNSLENYRSSMRGAINLAASDLQIEKTWSDTLFLGDVLEKYIVDPTVRKIDELEEIVRELAERGPFINQEFDFDVCADCKVQEGAKGDRPLSFPEMHEPRCLWRRSKALYPSSEVQP